MTSSSYPTGEQLIATILKHDNKTTSYKIALLRALNDIALAYPGITDHVAVPLKRIADLWAAYYWPFMDEAQPVYQGGRSFRDGVFRNDLSFRPALTQLKALYPSQSPSDGFFLLAEMRTPRRRAQYAPALLQAHDVSIRQITQAVAMPIKFAGEGHWTVFTKPDQAQNLRAHPLPGTLPQDVCVVVPAPLWQAFHNLSLYVEALCLHEWSLFTQQVKQDTPCSRGQAYMLLTARPDNRRPLQWERNQVDVLLYEGVPFTCPWTQKRIVQPQEYDLDHLLPLSIYPINELWNLLPVDKVFNQRVKRNRLASPERLAQARPWLARAYEQYAHSPALHRAIHEDATLRFAGINAAKGNFAASLAQHATQFIDEVATARFITRF
ncbi:hypothetical protein GCM10028822_32710 [Hymenobacter terrigena]